MTPENPIATELAALKRRVDQIFAHVALQRSPADSVYKRADLMALMNLIEALAGQRTVSSSDLEDLITNETSERFDEWVRKTQEAYFGEISENDFDDIPF